MPDSLSESADSQVERVKRHERNARWGMVGGCLTTVSGYCLGVFVMWAVTGEDQAPPESVIWAFVLAGIGLYLWGCCSFAKSKGYHWAWGLLGIANLLGLLILFTLPYKKGTYPDGPGRYQQRYARYQRNAFLGAFSGMIGLIIPWLIAFGPDLTSSWPEWMDNLEYSDILLATVIVCYVPVLWGGYYLVKRKGYHASLALFGLLWFLGFWVLCWYDDRNKNEYIRLGKSLFPFLYVACLIIFIEVFFTTVGLPSIVAHKWTLADKTAHSDLAQLGEAFKKLGKERSHLKCESCPVSDELIALMVGPHYGWKGTAPKRRVLIRMEDNELRSCSKIGTRPHGRNTRKTFRLRISDFTELPVIAGPCFGKRYGGAHALCYTESILNPDCTLRKREGVPCREVRGFVE